VTSPNGNTFTAKVVGSANAPFRFADTEVQQVLEAMNRLGQMRLKPDDVAQGMVLPQETVTAPQLERLNNPKVRIGDGIFILSVQEANRIAKTETEKELIKPFYTTEQLGRYYGEKKTGRRVLYTTRAVENSSGCASIKRHLDRFQSIITSSNKPYGLHRPRDPYYFEGTKLIALRKTDVPRFTYVDFPCYVTQTFNVIKPRLTTYDLRFLAGVLNSRVSHFWFLKAGKVQGDQLQVDIEPICRIPLPSLNMSKSGDRTLHDKMVALVNRMLALHKNLAIAKVEGQKTIVQRQISHTDAEIDRLVYGLYGLTKDEIAIVENAST